MTASLVLAPADVAPACATPADLAAAARTCVACDELARTRTNVVPGALPPGAELLLVGEAPGAQEDAEGVPFVGRSGQLLDQLLTEVAIPRTAVAVANTLKCRPPANRPPRRGELANCRPWLTRQIELADPLLVVALGGTATAWFLGPGAPLGANRGVVHEYAGRPLLVTYHPSAAIRFGPKGAPRAALRADLGAVAALLARLRAEAGR